MFLYFRKIKFFYEREFYRICNKVNRNKSFSIVLLLISQSQIYYILSNPFIDEFRKHSNTLELFNYFFDNIMQGFLISNFNFQLHQTETYSDIFIIIILVKQTLFMVSLVFLFYNYSKQIHLDSDEIMSSIISLESSKKIFTSNGFFFQFFEIYLSFSLKTYQYILYYPVIYQTIKNLSLKRNIDQNLQQKEVFMIFITMFVFINNSLLYHICEEHNYQFSFKRQDFLSQIYTFKARIQSILIEILTLIVLFFKNYNISKTGIQSTILIILIFIIIIAYKYPRYQFNTIQKIYFQTFTYFFLNNLVILIFAQLGNQDFSLIIFFIIPLVFKISSRLLQNQENQYNIIDYESDYFDNHMMITYDQCYQTLSNNGILLNEAKYRLPNNLNLYTLSTNHFSQCINEIPDQCFCWTYKSQESKFTSRTQYKQYVKDLIRFHYEQKLKLKQQSYSLQSIISNFFYILYLSKVIKQPTKAFYEMILIKNQLCSYLSWIAKMYLHQVEASVKQDFLRMTQLKNITNQKYDCQLVFNYHEAIKEWKSRFFQATKNLKSWYQLILQRQFKQILSVGLKIFDKNQKLEHNLKQIFELNPFSTECSLLITLFYKYINFNNKKIEVPSTDSAFSIKFQNSIKGILFHKDAAFVYLTLLNQKGLIKRYSRTFREALQTTDQNILNKPINNFIPAIIAKVHDQYLDNFVERGRINIMKSEQRFLLVKNSLGFVSPIIAKVKLETDLGDDFGSAALILPTYTNYHYIILNSYGLIEEISEKLYKQVIFPILNVELENLNKIDCLKLLPKLLISWKNIFIQKKLESDLKELSETYLIFPKKTKKQQMILQSPTKDQNELDYFQAQEKINEVYFEKLEKIFMFKVQFRIIEFQTFQGAIYSIEIQTIKPVRISQRKEIFNRLLGKQEFAFLSRRKIQTLDDKKNKQKKIDYTPENYQKETYGYIPYVDHITLSNLDSQKLIEDDYMILLKEKQIFLTNPFYSRQINEINKIDINEQQISARISDYKMKSSIGQNNFVSFNQYNSSLSNVFSANFQDRLLVHSSAVLEALNDNKESVKSQNSVDGLGSQDQFLSEMDQIQSITSSQISDLRVKKIKIRNNLQHVQSYQTQVIKFLNLIFFLTLFILNSIYFYFEIVQNQIIDNAYREYQFTNDLNVRLNLFILSYNFSNTKTFNHENYLNFSANEFQDDIKSIQFYAQSLNEKKIQYLEVSSIEKLYNLSLFYSLSYLSSYFLYSMHQKIEENFLELIARNFITLNEESKVLNQTIIQESYLQFQNSGSNIVVIFSIVITVLFLVHGFYFYVLQKIYRMKHKIRQLFGTLSKFQVQNVIESLQFIIRYFETFDFVNEPTKEYQIEQIKMKITQSPGMIRLLQSNRMVKLKVHQNNSQSKLIYLLYIVTQLVSFLLISSQYFGSLIYQYQFQLNTLDQFKQFFIYKSTQILILQQLSYQKFLVKYEQQGNPEILFQNNWNESIIYMNNEIQTLNLFIKRLNDQKNFPNTIFSDTIKVDACQSLNLYSTSFENQFYQQNICKNIGALNQGLTIQLSNFYQNFLQFYTLHDQNLQIFKQYLSSNVTNQTFIETIENTLYTQYILNQLYNVITDNSNLDFQQDLLIHSVLFGLGTFIYIILLLLSNKKLDSYLYNQIIRTKQLFFLIPFEYLCENAYILQFMINTKNQDVNS